MDNKCKWAAEDPSQVERSSHYFPADQGPHQVGQREGEEDNGKACSSSPCSPCSSQGRGEDRACPFASWACAEDVVRSAQAWEDGCWALMLFITNSLFLRIDEYFNLRLCLDYNSNISIVSRMELLDSKSICLQNLFLKTRCKTEPN